MDFTVTAQDLTIVYGLDSVTYFPCSGITSLDARSASFLDE